MMSDGELSAKIDLMLERQEALMDYIGTISDRLTNLTIELQQNAYPKGAVSEDYDDEIQRIAEEVKAEEAL